MTRLAIIDLGLLNRPRCNGNISSLEGFFLIVYILHFRMCPKDVLVVLLYEYIMRNYFTISTCLPFICINV